jgi:hypothetical protein
MSGRPRTKVTGTVGRTNGGPPKAVVILDDPQEWLTPSQARALAARLNRASDEALEKYGVYRAKALIEVRRKKGAAQ